MGYFDLVRVMKEVKSLASKNQRKTSFVQIGDEFCKIGVREPQKNANEAFCEFGEYHR